MTVPIGANLSSLTPSMTALHMCRYRIARKLSREKTFKILWLFAKVFSVKFGGVATFFFRKILFLRKFPAIRYMLTSLLVWLDRDTYHKF